MTDFAFDATGRVEDPDIDDVAPGGQGFTSDLEELAALVQQDPELADTTELEIPGRAGYSVRYRTTVEHEELKRWQRKARSRHSGGDSVDEMRVATLIVVNTCQAICKAGEPLELDGKPITFATKAFQDSIGVQQAGQAVKALFVLDSSILAHAEAILDEAGFGSVAAAADPR